MKRERDKSADIMRGIAIIVMILGHAGIGIESHDHYFSIWYHAWHMPLFYIVSGYFFNGTDIEKEQYIPKLARKLLIPYFLWCLINIAINYLENRDIGSVCSGIVDTMIKQPELSGIDHAGALWFLPALFWLCVIFFCLKNIIKNNALLYTICFAAGICGMIAQNYGRFLPLGIGPAIVGLPFIAMGDLLREKSDTVSAGKIMNMKWYALAVVLIVSLFLVYFNGEVNFRTGEYRNYVLTVVNAIIVTLVVWNVSRNLGEVRSGTGLQVLPDCFATIGKESIIFLVLNQRVLYYIQPVAVSICGEGRPMFLHYVSLFIALLFTCFVCHILYIMLSESRYLHILVGKH